MMNSQEVVNVVKLVVRDAAVADILSALDAPPGGKPNEAHVKPSSFYNEMSLDDKRQIEQIVEMSVESSIFEFLCVLDGVRAIANGADKGSLSLLY
jgi:hypothetical protein